MWSFFPKFEEALIYATRVHGGQPRKKTRISSIGHLVVVTAIAIVYGSMETEAIGALLHEPVEDCGGPPRQREIEEIFGKDVGEIVAGCTDTDKTPKPPWRERKEKYIAHLEMASASTRLVSGSDKLHNARAICTICAKTAMRSGRDLMAARRGRFGIIAR